MRESDTLRAVSIANSFQSTGMVAPYKIPECTAKKRSQKRRWTLSQRCLQACRERQGPY